MKEEAMNQTLECRVLRFLELQLRVQISVGVVLKIRGDTHQLSTRYISIDLPVLKIFK